MEDLTKKQQFVELRAKGKSYAKIAIELEVSKTTLIDWSKGLAEEISNLRAIELEELRERYKVGKEHRLKLLSEQLEGIRTELSNRKLNDVPTDKLIDLLYKFSETIGKEDIQPVFTRTSPGLSFDELETTSKWSA